MRIERVSFDYFNIRNGHGTSLLAFRIDLDREAYVSGRGDHSNGIDQSGIVMREDSDLFAEVVAIGHFNSLGMGML